MVDDLDDPYIAAQRRAARNKAIGAALVVLVVALGILWTLGQKQAARDAVVADTEAMISDGSYEGLTEASRTVGREASADELAPPTLHLQGVKADLALWALYSGASSVTGKAAELLDIARVRGPDEPATHFAEALWEAVVGDPNQALTLLQSTGDTPTWNAIAKAEAQVRSGDLDGARATLGACEVGVCRAWSARIAMDVGDWEAAKALGDALVASKPDHMLGRTAQVLASARALAPDLRVERLQAYMEEARLPPMLQARVVVDLSRALRVTEGPKRADALLEGAIGQSPDSAILANEAARTARFQGSFGAAWTRVDKALRNSPADPGLLTELAAALYFNDAAALLEDRLEPAEARGSAGDGVTRGRAVAALIHGLYDRAIEGLQATRHLGEPGDTELFLAEAYSRKGEWAKAAEAARDAHAKLAGTYGAESREAAIAKMYEGLAVGLGGDEDAASELLSAAYGKDTRTVWGAWIYGRYHEGREKYADAKDAYLLACHNGQDFALACLDLANVYDSLTMDDLMRRTQTEARRSYLRQSPKGRHAAAVKAALGE